MTVKRCRKVVWSDPFAHPGISGRGEICWAECLILDTKVNNSSRPDLLWSRILVSGPNCNESESYRIACMYWVVRSIGEF